MEEERMLNHFKQQQAQKQAQQQQQQQAKEKKQSYTPFLQMKPSNRNYNMELPSQGQNQIPDYMKTIRL
jgi:hypothetical protein